MTAFTTPGIEEEKNVKRQNTRHKPNGRVQRDKARSNHTDILSPRLRRGDIFPSWVSVGRGCTVTPDSENASVFHFHPASRPPDTSYNMSGCALRPSRGKSPTPRRNPRGGRTTKTRPYIRGSVRDSAHPPDADVRMTDCYAVHRP